MALCTTGYWEMSQHKLLWILCRTEAKSWHLAGSGSGQQAKFSQLTLLFKVMDWSRALLCCLWVDFLVLKQSVRQCTCFYTHKTFYYSCFHDEQWICFDFFFLSPSISVSCHLAWWFFSSFVDISNCLLQSYYEFCLWTPLCCTGPLLYTLPIYPNVWRVWRNLTSWKCAKLLFRLMKTLLDVSWRGISRMNEINSAGLQIACCISIMNK